MKSLELKVLGPRGEVTDVHCQSEVPTFKDRLFKGSKTGLILFVITLFTVFIPGLHFVSVPLGLLISSYFLFIGMTKSQTLQVPQFSCPICGDGQVAATTTTVATDTFYLNCPACKGLLKVKV